MDSLATSASIEQGRKEGRDRKGGRWEEGEMRMMMRERAMRRVKERESLSLNVGRKSEGNRMLYTATSAVKSRQNFISL